MAQAGRIDEGTHNVKYQGSKIKKIHCFNCALGLSHEQLTWELEEWLSVNGK